MWGILVNLIGGPIINGLIGAYKARLEAGNTSERIAADLAMRELALEEQRRKLATELTIVHEGRWWTALPRAVVTYCFAAYIAKIVMWDTMFGWGVTPPLGGDVQAAFQWLVALWFGGRTLEKVAAAFRR